MKDIRYSMVLLLVFLSGISLSAKKQSAEADSVRILFIGNSYTFYNKMPHMVDSIARSQKRKVSVTSVVKGGQQLSGHLKNAKLLSLLKKGGWNYVVIQERSTNPAMPTGWVAENVYPYAHTLDSLIKAGSPNAEVIFYMTWGHKYGYKKKMAEYPAINSYEGMQMRLAGSYLEMAYDNEARCAPVGLAWWKIRRERPGIILYNQDCSHPSVVGSYLAANVIYTTIFPAPYQTSYTAGLPAGEAEYIQQEAQNMVLGNERLLNIKE